MTRWLVSFAVIFFALTRACFAQGMIEPGGAGAPKYGLPGPICASDLNLLMTPELYSSGDQHNGFVYGWSFAKHCFMLEPPKLLVGPGNLAADKALVQNTFTFLDGAVGSGGGLGFRAGAQYPPGGVYMVWGVYTFLTTTANSLYEIEVTIGTVDAGGAQATMLTGSPVAIGGGANTSGAGGTYVQVTVFVPKVQCGAGRGGSCEIRFLVRTTDTAGTAKIQTPNLPTNIVSANGLSRMGGFDGLQ